MSLPRMRVALLLLCRLRISAWSEGCRSRLQAVLTVAVTSPMKINASTLVAIRASFPCLPGWNDTDHTWAGKPQTRSEQKFQTASETKAENGIRQLTIEIRP